MIDRESFSIYLETSGPGALARRAIARLGTEVATEARERCSGRVLMRGRAPEDVEALLGPADIQNGSSLGYVLSTWPGYVYVIEFEAPDGTFSGSGFRRLAPQLEIPEEWRALSSELTKHLARIGATRAEVRAWFGNPANQSGWWPTETWEYSDGRAIEFRHGIVEETGE